MIDYKDFVIPEFYWDYFVREKRSLFISSYLKDNNILPSEDMIKNFIIEEKEREDFRRMLYSKYCISGVMPEIPNVPNVPILPDNPKPEYDLDSNAIICTYNINTTGYTDLYKIRPNCESYIEKVIYNGEEITPLFNGSTVKYDFQKMGDIKLEYVLKDNTTSMHNVLFGGTRLKEIVIPSCINTLHKASSYDNGIFCFSNQNNAVFNKIISLNKTAPLLEGSSKNVVTVPYFNNGYHSKGTLYVPKDCSINYASWMGDGKTDLLLAHYDWDIKELDY